MIDTEHFESLARFVSGEEIPEEEKLKIRARNVKYELVRYLVMEKGMNVNGVNFQLKNFHFTPGHDFMEIPTIDIVNSILNIDIDDSGIVDPPDLED